MVIDSIREKVFKYTYVGIPTMLILNKKQERELYLEIKDLVSEEHKLASNGCIKRYVTLGVELEVIIVDEEEWEITVVVEPKENVSFGKEGRRTGRTTRLINEYIEVLFNKGVINIRDHHSSREASKFLVTTLVRRLNIEHQMNQKHLDVEEKEGNIIIKLK